MTCQATLVKAQEPTKFWAMMSGREMDGMTKIQRNYKLRLVHQHTAPNKPPIGIGH